MACETFDETINGVQYVTTQWPATKQVLMKLKLVKVFGDALFDIVQGITTKEKNESKRQEAQLKAFQNAIHSLFESSSPEDITGLIREVLTCGATKREGKRITVNEFDSIYNDAGLKEMYLACLFVVKSNYADFFKGQKAEEFLAQVESL
jgi:hypothetical protein